MCNLAFTYKATARVMRGDTKEQTFQVCNTVRAQDEDEAKLIALQETRSTVAAAFDGYSLVSLKFFSVDRASDCY